MASCCQSVGHRRVRENERRDGNTSSVRRDRHAEGRHGDLEEPTTTQADDRRAPPRAREARGRPPSRGAPPRAGSAACSEGCGSGSARTSRRRARRRAREGARAAVPAERPEPPDAQRGRRGRRTGGRTARVEEERSADRNPACSASAACLKDRLTPAREAHDPRPVPGERDDDGDADSQREPGRGAGGGPPRRSAAEDLAAERRQHVDGERRLRHHAEAQRHAEGHAPAGAAEALGPGPARRAPPPPSRPAAGRAGSWSARR